MRGPAVFYLAINAADVVLLATGFDHHHAEAVADTRVRFGAAQRSEVAIQSVSMNFARRSRPSDQKR